MTRKAQADNRRLAKVAVQCSADQQRLMVNQSLVFRINICGKNAPSTSRKTLATI